MMVVEHYQWPERKIKVFLFLFGGIMNFIFKKINNQKMALFFLDKKNNRTIYLKILCVV